MTLLLLLSRAKGYTLGPTQLREEIRDVFTKNKRQADNKYKNVYYPKLISDSVTCSQDWDIASICVAMLRMDNFNSFSKA